MLVYSHMQEKTQQKNINFVWFQYFFLFFIGLLCVYGIRIMYVHFLPQPPFSPSLSTLTLSPPTKSFKGKISQMQGIVEKRGRDDTEFQKVKDITIVQGDSLATKQGSAQIFLNEQITVLLSPHTEIGFVTLLPDTLLFKQSEGTIFYDVTTRFSVRALHVLVDASSPLTIIMNVSQIVVSTKTDPVKFGLVDLENNTHVYTVNTGETAKINDETRSVEIN